MDRRHDQSAIERRGEPTPRFGRVASWVLVAICAGLLVIYLWEHMFALRLILAGMRQA